MRSQYDVHVRNCIARAIAPSYDSCFERLQRFLAAVHARIGDRQTEPWSAGEIMCLFIKCNRIIEASHLAIQRCQRWLAIMGKCRIKLQRAFACSNRFVVKTEITVKLAGKVADPE